MIDRIGEAILWFREVDDSDDELSGAVVLEYGTVLADEIERLQFCLSDIRKELDAIYDRVSELRVKFAWMEKAK